MRKVLGLLLMIGALLVGRAEGGAQAPAAPRAPAASAASAEAERSGVADSRTEKQRALAAQAEQLFSMATELKAQVDLTNKNILSLKVVQKAEAIEALAKGMRVQARK